MTPLGIGALSSSGAAVVLGSFTQREAKRRSRGFLRSGRVRLAVHSSTELLVDGDQHSTNDIKQAIGILKQHGGHVHTTILGAPGMFKRRTWGHFMQGPGITFQPVPRSSEDHFAEPNDSAIVSAMQTLSTHNGIHRIALLTSDAGFIDTMLRLDFPRSRYLVFVPDFFPHVAAKYEEVGFQVLRLEAIRKDRGSRVRAMLHADGTGSVLLADSWDAKSIDQYLEKRAVVNCFLEDLGYVQNQENLVPASAKFWLAHGLGRLVVYPGQLATLAVHELVTQSRSWARYRSQCAFFIPNSKTSGKSVRIDQKYGSSRSHAIFKGGGPFMLTDTKNLTIRALKRLGYIDKWNADEHEALLCFVNSSDNRKVLRKMNLLPQPLDRCGDVKEKLRAAFLSNKYQGWWQLATPAASKMRQIAKILIKSGFLPKTESRDSYCGGHSKSEISLALKMYVQKLQLPPMKTFNGLAWRILRDYDSSDTTRSAVEFRREL